MLPQIFYFFAYFSLSTSIELKPSIPYMPPAQVGV